MRSRVFPRSSCKLCKNQSHESREGRQPCQTMKPTTCEDAISCENVANVKSNPLQEVDGGSAGNNEQRADLVGRGTSGSDDAGGGRGSAVGGVVASASGSVGGVGGSHGGAGTGEGKEDGRELHFEVLEF